MARDGGVSCLRSSEMIGIGIGGLESPPLDSDEVHVLAVDDSLVDRIVIERLLRITSCKVTAVDSGWRALEFLGLDEEKTSVEFDRLKVDLIITDYCMPGMTGYELLKKIKESTSFRQVPVVIMSSENVMTRIDRCLEEGAEDFLLKPVKLADVKRLTNYLTRDVKVANGNNKKLPEDLNHFSSPPARAPETVPAPAPAPATAPAPAPATAPATAPAPAPAPETLPDHGSSPTPSPAPSASIEALECTRPSSPAETRSPGLD